MRKVTLLIASLFIAIGAMAQTQVLELSASQIGTTYPKQLSDEDAAKVYDLTNLTVAVRINTPSTMNGRKALFAISDPTMEKNTTGEGVGSRYVAYGIYGGGPAYLASWRDGDRFSGTANKIPTNREDVIVTYVINSTGHVVSLYVNGAKDKEWSGNSAGFSSGYEMATPGMVKTAHPNANIYIGGGKYSGGNSELFNGTITGLKVYDGVLTADQVAAISFDNAEELAQARSEFEAAYASAQAILDEANLTVTKKEITLQVDNSNSSYYLWSNAPEPNEGHIRYLVDGSVGAYKGNEFFHTQWSVPVPAGPHYIEVDLGTDNALSEFSFGYNTRNFDGGADFPYTIKVLASNNKSDYNEIYSVTNLPIGGNKRFDSDIINSETAYRYIRFSVTETKSQNRTYWHMSEFDLFKKQISVTDRYQAVASEVASLKTICDTYSDVNTNNVASLNAAAEAINAAIEAVNAGAVTPEFTYESLDKPTFAKGGNTTKVAMVKLNGENLEGFTYTQGQTTRFNMPQVVAGQTYNLDLTYEMAWGDLAIFQIDKNSNEKKYGYYTCVWEANGSPFAILVENDANKELMCQELEIPSIESLEAISAGEFTYLKIPYKITIPENLEAGDVVVVRVMVGKEDNGAYNAKDIVEGGCLDLVFEVKKSHTLTVGSAGYATLFLDYNAAIPENLEAYTVTAVNDGYAKLNLVEGVLPANTGVIVKASAANYSFDASTEEATDVTGNLLTGSVGDEYVEGAAYVLGILDGNVGLYSAKLNKNATGGDGNTHFLNNAYKAYLPASALTSNANMLRFDFSGETTGVEEVEVESTVKTIYDLSGRKVSGISAPGLYIVNGKKVLVK